ncbi:MAG TPA: nuclear transport factor 2 family protein [Acidimicrobiia bacterium]|nr:nuclear transport factor 2 family protein [Acidimicrobiia bacterium]
MIDSMTNTDLIRRGYQAFNEADVDTLQKILADDVTWTTPGESTVAGTARGKAAVLTQFGRYAGETEGTFKADLLEVFEGENGRVIGLHHNTGTRNGYNLDTRCCIVFDIRNSQIVSATENFFDLYNWDHFWS